MPAVTSTDSEALVAVSGLLAASWAPVALSRRMATSRLAPAVKTAADHVVTESAKVPSATTGMRHQSASLRLLMTPKARNCPPVVKVTSAAVLVEFPASSARSGSRLLMMATSSSLLVAPAY